MTTQSFPYESYYFKGDISIQNKLENDSEKGKDKRLMQCPLQKHLLVYFIGKLFLVLT